MSKLPIEVQNTKLLDFEGKELENAPTLQDYLALRYDYEKLQSKMNDIHATIENTLIALDYLKPFLLIHLQRASKISLNDLVKKLKSDSWAISGTVLLDLVNGNIRTKEIKNTLQTVKDFADFWKKNRDIFNNSDDLLNAIDVTRISEIDKHRFAQLIAVAIYLEKSLQTCPEEFTSFIYEFNKVLTIETYEQ